MVETRSKPFVISELLYEQNDLAPVISAETVGYHYNKHHRTYLNKLNSLVIGTEFQDLELEDVILKTAGQAGQEAIFNNAAQVWNHDFYWNSLSPKGGGKPAGEIGMKIDADLGGYENFIKKFVEAGVTNFGSGWVWLVEDRGILKITQTHNADNPISQGQGKALLGLDVWEHAYYLDYQNRRNDHLKLVLEKLINWNFAEMNLAEWEQT